jgi:hypothetical protein
MRQPAAKAEFPDTAAIVSIAGKVLAAVLISLPVWVPIGPRHFPKNETGAGATSADVDLNAGTATDTNTLIGRNGQFKCSRPVTYRGEFLGERFIPRGAVLISNSPDPATGAKRHRGLGTDPSDSK